MQNFISVERHAIGVTMNTLGQRNREILFKSVFLSLFFLFFIFFLEC